MNNMKTWITDKSWVQSAANLDQRRLQIQIHDCIHLLGAVYNCTRNLIKVADIDKKQPEMIKWKKYRWELYTFTQVHISDYIARGNKSLINTFNMQILYDQITMPIYFNNPMWINDDLILQNRIELIQRDPEHYQKIWPLVPNKI